MDWVSFLFHSNHDDTWYYYILFFCIGNPYPGFLNHFVGLVLRNEYNSFRLGQATSTTSVTDNEELDDKPDIINDDSSEQGYQTDIEEEIYHYGSDEDLLNFVDKELQQVSEQNEGMCTCSV